MRTRGARGGSKLNRTLRESPTHWRVRQQPRKKKHSLHFWFGGGGFFLEKGKGVFLSGFCPPSIRAVRGASIRTPLHKNVHFFLGKNDFFFMACSFSPPVGGVGKGMRPGFQFAKFFLRQCL